MSIVELSTNNCWYHISKQNCLMQNMLYELSVEFSKDVCKHIIHSRTYKCDLLASEFSEEMLNANSYFKNS